MLLLPIRFRTTTATAMLRLDRAEALDRLAALCLANAKALMAALEYRAAHGIGDFRVNSQIMPVRTHPKAGYGVGDLPDTQRIVAAFKRCGRFAREHGLRLTFHPDQFVLLSSPRPAVTVNSIAELVYQAEVAEWVNADVINIHAGGGYGDKRGALGRLGKDLTVEVEAKAKELAVLRLARYLHKLGAMQRFPAPDVCPHRRAVGRRLPGLPGLRLPQPCDPTGLVPVVNEVEWSGRPPSTFVPTDARSAGGCLAC
jgi:UV DNA damage repair endonuclease